MANCINCSETMGWLNHVKADVFDSAVGPSPVIDLILRCPYCTQEYNAFVPVDDLIPLGE
ncbi:hypothetical protein JD974_04220 [Chromobacterium haemolyticum]|uniref:Uncharacterized protein n=1 Tax=Chromobacterium haemolyticum TaxID=394935 RepID=A0ABS3GI37_9NEIS|nr:MULTISPECIES: hypothetical protein [Chromobacterium]MBK0413606.1 hypothetical protein [Chromobacterium haemolyticum]MBO0414708.1 hypothetical protein [Chromobacterium haemolyticum]MBO0497969.1 hypothetical protein [Chromobacterium haemolyticum]